jgi:hypothetical protein
MLKKTKDKNAPLSGQINQLDWAPKVAQIGPIELCLDRTITT